MKTAGRRPVRVVVESLGVPSLVTLALSWRRGAFGSGGPLELHVLYSLTGAARTWGAWLRWFGVPVTLYEVDFDLMDDVRFPDGRRALEEIYYHAGPAFVGQLECDPWYIEAVRQGIRAPSHEPALRAYLSKRIFMDQGAGPLFGQGLRSVLVAAWYCQTRWPDDQGAPQLLYVRDSWLFPLLVEYGAQQWNIQLRPLPVGPLVWGRFKRAIREFFRPARHYARCLLDRGHVVLPGRASVRIAAEMFCAGVAREPIYNTEFFWYRQSNLPEGAVFGYFAHPHDQPTVSRQAYLRERGIGWMDQAALRWLQGIPSAGSVPLHGSTLPQVLRTYVREFYAEYARWQRIFSATGTRIHVSTYDIFPQSEALHMALADLGGVSVSIQRSIERETYRLRQTATDVHFAFSTSQAERERQSGSCIRQFVTAGYFVDDMFETARVHAQQLARRFDERGMIFRVAFFDEGEGILPKIIGGRRQLQGDYQFLCDQMAADPTLGIILKPKHSDTLPRRLGPVWDRLQTFIASEQCLLLGNGSFDENYLPCVAACVADVAVNLLGGGTAGLESRLAGTRTLLVRHGAELGLFGPLKDRVVFETWHDAWKAIEHVRANPGDRDIGNWDSVLDDVASLRDGLAARRINEYVTWLYEALVAGRSREDAMADASQRYTETWGESLVTEIRQPPLGVAAGVGECERKAHRSVMSEHSLV